MTFPGLPARVDDPEWERWLLEFPPIPPQTLGEAMRFHRQLTAHLDAMPNPADLTDAERRNVGDDLAHYCMSLQDAQEASLREAWLSLAGSAASLAAKLYFPGAEIILLAIAAGLGLVALGRAYDIKRRQSLIKRLMRRVDKLSWDLKR